MNKEELLDNINEQQRAFCELYMTGQTTMGGKKIEIPSDKMYNKTYAYAFAYGKDMGNSSEAVQSRTSGYRLYTNDYIKEYIKYLKEEAGFNDEYIDAVGMKWLRSADAPISLKAMVELNKIRGRLSSEEKDKNVSVTNVGSGVVHVHIPK